MLVAGFSNSFFTFFSPRAVFRHVKSNITGKLSGVRKPSDITNLGNNGHGTECVNATESIQRIFGFFVTFTLCDMGNRGIKLFYAFSKTGILRQ